MVRIGLITIVTNRLAEMKSFYENTLGFECIEELEGYVEFRSVGVRFALTTDKVMHDATGHSSYLDSKSGQRFELAFPIADATLVEDSYDRIIANGAMPVSPPKLMPWGRVTAFFADPDGNVHELYSLKESEEI